jgi:methylmalonyl-CoA mutase cobalamin-binding domain/chain
MQELAKALSELDESRVMELVEEALQKGVPPVEIVEICNQGMTEVGDLFASGTYFISQLLFSAEILKGVMKRIDPLLAKVEKGDSGEKVVLGTVKGDIHDIGKNIVATLFRGAGFDVIDLGVDVPAEQFVAKAKETGAKIVGLSALLSFTYPEMKNVVEAFVSAGIRDKVKIIIGGAPVNEQVREFTGADFYAKDAIAGVRLCKKIYGDK